MASITATEATSFTEPKCPIGMRSGLAFGLLVIISVSINAGEVAFAVMPSRANAAASECVSPMIPAFRFAQRDDRCHFRFAFGSSKDVYALAFGGIGDKRPYVVYGRGQAVPLTKSFFDEQTGLLPLAETAEGVTNLGLSATDLERVGRMNALARPPRAASPGARFSAKAAERCDKSDAWRPVATCRVQVAR